MSIIEHNPTPSRLAPTPVRERVSRATPASAQASSSRASSSADNASAARAATLLPSRFEVLWEIGTGAIASLPDGVAGEKVCATHVRWTIVRDDPERSKTFVSRHLCVARCELVLTMKDGSAHTQTLHEGVRCAAHHSIDAPSLVSVESDEHGLLSLVFGLLCPEDPIRVPRHSVAGALESSTKALCGVAEYPEPCFGQSIFGPERMDPIGIGPETAVLRGPLYARTSVLLHDLGLKGGVYDQPTIALSA